MSQNRIRREIHAKANRVREAATLADMIDQKLLIFCFCNHCGHNSEMDPRYFIQSLGPSFPIPALCKLMHCSSCKGKDITTRPAWPNHGGGQIARHD